MRKNVVIGVLSLIGLGAFAGLGSSPNFAGKIIESLKRNTVAKIFSPPSEDTVTKADEEIKAADSSSTEIPEYILYDRMFSLIQRFKQLAEAQESKGDPVTAFHGYFEREVNLSDGQRRILQDTAAAYVEAVNLVDAQAEIVIEQLRLQNPPGSMPEGKLIRPSPELLQLQEQRNKLALYYRDQLGSLLGNEKFGELDEFVRGRFASGFQVLPLSSIQDSEDKGGEQ